MSTALILAGGELRATAALRARAADASLVVAADGGLRHAEALGVTPELIVGDFDSVRDATLARWPDLPRETHDADKDDLDLELAVAAARRRGARNLLLAGALGGRFDQSLAALLIALRLRGEGVRATLHSGEQEVRPLTAGDLERVDAAPGTRFSLLALPGVSGAAEIANGAANGARVSVRGASYELERGELAWGIGLGLSNEIGERGRAEITVHAGAVALWIAWLEPEPG